MLELDPLLSSSYALLSPRITIQGHIVFGCQSVCNLVFVQTISLKLRNQWNLTHIDHIMKWCLLLFVYYKKNSYFLICGRHGEFVCFLCCCCNWICPLSGATWTGVEGQIQDTILHVHRLRESTQEVFSFKSIKKGQFRGIYHHLFL